MKLLMESWREFINEAKDLVCPKPTQDLELNTKNRNAAIKAEHIQYGPLNLADEEYWERAAEHWNTDVEVAKESKCGNCVAFDISPRMLDCMPGPTSEPIEDEEGKLGYCWMHHFKCHSARTCYTNGRKRTKKQSKKQANACPVIRLTQPAKPKKCLVRLTETV
jgi:hypothetical protein